MPVLEIEDLLKSYVAPDGERQVVIDVTRFVLEEDEHLAVRGASGSGKTTFLNLISGILEPDRGQVMIDGQNIALLPESKRDQLRAEKVGYVFQTFNLLQGHTALENVELGMAFGRGIDTERARTLLKRVGLSDRLDHLPRQLSVGQQQRVALARALANHPRLVLADEPTGNLDPTRAREAIDLLVEVCEEAGASLLVVSHDANVLGRFERVRDLSDINRAEARARADSPAEVRA